MITASALPRLFSCPGSHALPQQDERSPWSELGDQRHAEKEADVHASDFSSWPESIRALIRQGDLVTAEAAVAYDVATGEARELGHGIGRDYGAMGPFEIAGQLDVLIVGQRRAVVADWKGFETTEHASRNRQTSLYALAVARLYQLDEVTVAIHHLGTGRATTATLDVFELDAFAQELRALHKAVVSPDAPINPGKHCKYCPAFSACPKQQALALEVRSGAADVRTQALIPMNDDESARDAYEFAQRVRMLLRRLDAAIYARAQERAIPLGEGRVFGVVRKQGNEKLAGDVVHTVVKEMHGADMADACVEMTATKSRLKDALKTLAKGSQAAAERAILAEVRRRDGAKREWTEKVEEHVLQLADGTP